MRSMPGVGGCLRDESGRAGRSAGILQVEPQDEALRSLLERVRWLKNGNGAKVSAADCNSFDVKARSKWPDSDEYAAGRLLITIVNCIEATYHLA